MSGVSAIPPTSDMFGFQSSGVDKVPVDIATRGLRWSGGTQNVQNNETCCGFFEMRSVLMKGGSSLYPCYEMWGKAAINYRGLSTGYLYHCFKLTI
jgi:hypothetical protein